MTEYEKKKLINRLKMWLMDLENDMDKGDYGELCENKGARESIESCICEIEELPVTDVQPVKRGEWISCKDRMPKENTLVLCYAKSTAGEGNNYFLGAQAHGEFWFLKVNDIGHVSCPVLHWEVTHWMPLPEPPKDGDT